MKLFFKKRWARLTFGGTTFGGPFFPPYVDDLNLAFDLFLNATGTEVVVANAHGRPAVHVARWPKTSDDYQWAVSITFTCADHDSCMVVLFPHSRKDRIEAERSIALYTYGDPPRPWMADTIQLLGEALLGFRSSFTRGSSLPFVRP